LRGKHALALTLEHGRETLVHRRPVRAYVVREKETPDDLWALHVTSVHGPQLEVALVLPPFAAVEVFQDARRLLEEREECPIAFGVVLNCPRRVCSVCRERILRTRLGLFCERGGDRGAEALVR
jgi:hypothetical protein